MKKTFNINLAGVAFVIDDDAYTLLNDYLDTLAHTFRNVEDSQDIINDLESRIAELLLEMNNGTAIITTDMVKQAMTRLGSPDEMIEDEEIISVSDTTGEPIIEENIRTQTTPPPYNKEVPHIKKRLFRDPQDSIIGGVCSGIGWYLGVDATWIRVAVVILTLVSFSTFCLAYIILWIVVPAANTPTQRLEMMGERPTMENIARTVSDTYEEEQNLNNTGYSYIHSPNTPILVRILIIFGLIIGFPILLGMCLGLLGCLFFLIMVAVTYFSGSLPDWLGNDTEVGIAGIITAIFAILTIGIPLAIFVLKGISNEDANRFVRRHKQFLLFSWLTFFACTAVMVGVMIHYDVRKDRESYERYLERKHTEQAEGWTVITDEPMNDSIFLNIAESENIDSVTVSSLPSAKDSVAR